MTPSQNHNDPLQRKLDDVLNNIPLESPSPDFIDRVMQSMARLPSSDVKSHGRKMYVQPIKNQWIHAIVATAGTFVFMVSGAFQTIASSKSIELGVALQAKAGDAVTIGAGWIFELTEQISKWF